MNNISITPGDYTKLGATYDGNGVNFAIFSEAADYIELCIFDGVIESRAVLPARTDDGVWHGYVKGLEIGTRYGFRVYGQYAPEQGKRFNPNKLLIDPYAKAFDAEFMWHDSLLGYEEENGYNSFDTRDSALYVPKSIVIDEKSLFKYPEAARPSVPWHETIIYETHVKGMSILNTEIHEGKRGNFAGLSEKKVIEYIKSLGVTSIELLPIFACCTDRYLGPKGLSNYWGYDTVGFFAPRYSYGQVLEFKKMVNALHDAGIEVILDVVYNHTGDSDFTGPTLMFKGIDNEYYYRLDKEDKSKYSWYSGCGNVLDTNKPYVQKMIQDSLVYWSKLGVDGYRFDLMSAMGRDENHHFTKEATIFGVIKNTPELSGLKLIAEPWDASGEGFQLGNYPEEYLQWNARFRDTIRALTSSKEVRRGDIATVLSGSDWLGSNCCCSLSLNYIFSHDGFTMNDFFSYTNKDNSANPWENNDGPNEQGFNCGIEGPTDNPEVLQQRILRMKNCFALLMLAIGTPMFVAGDEKARTQQGNNNPYCQDNEISWINWDRSELQTQLFDFVSNITKIRKKYSDILGNKLVSPNDIKWYNNEFEVISNEEWNDNHSRSLNYLLEDRMYVAINLNDNQNQIKLPSGNWSLLISTNHKAPQTEDGYYNISSNEIAIFIKN